MWLLCLAACGSEDDARSTGPATLTSVSATASATDSSSGGTDPQSTGEAVTTSTTTTSGTGNETTAGSMPVLDVGAGTDDTGSACDPAADICCLEEGEIPPHALLDEFLAAYPDAAMPKTVADVQAFMPVADGHAMAWSDENVGGELVDATNGGVIEANIEQGRQLAGDAAAMAVPAGAIILEIRDDPVVIEDLGGPDPCIGVGWAWGSILFEDMAGGIGELVYLYIGLCDGNGDVEVFYYSDQSVQICEPPA